MRVGDGADADDDADDDRGSGLAKARGGGISRVFFFALFALSCLRKASIARSSSSSSSSESDSLSPSSDSGSNLCLRDCGWVCSSDSSSSVSSEGCSLVSMATFLVLGFVGVGFSDGAGGGLDKAG